MYLRNVLLLIKKKNKKHILNYYMKKVFPKFHIEINYDDANDINIDINISLTGPNGNMCPLELAGTGVLQSLQIFSYVTLFKPSLLLLDEPDSHLHPDNQSLLATILLTISTETSTQIIVSTHSRHIVDALYDEANFVWLKDGKVYDQGIGIDRLPFLLDLGALDSFDKLKNGSMDWVVLTEDSGFKPMQLLLESSGFNADSLVIYSYKSSSNIQSAFILAEFISEIASDTKIIIHRDSDFMTDEEKSQVMEKIEEIGAVSFLTSGSDIESYFLIPEHLAELLNVDIEEIEIWLSELAQKKHNNLYHSFVRKRDEINRILYKNGLKPPDTKKLLGEAIPLDPVHRLGKSMLKLVRSYMKLKFDKSVDPIAKSTNLRCKELEEILNEYT